MNKHAVPRRKVIIRPAYQIRLALTVFLYIVLYSVVLGGILFYPLYSGMESASSTEEQIVYSEVLLYLHRTFWPGFFVIAVIAGVHAIYASHRLVGPVYRFDRTLRSLIDGDYSLRIKIRKKDEFKEVEALLNELAESLERKWSRDRAFHRDLRLKVETTHAMLDRDDIPDCDKIVGNINEILADLDSFEQGRDKASYRTG